MHQTFCHHAFVAQEGENYFSFAIPIKNVGTTLLISSNFFFEYSLVHKLKIQKSFEITRV